MQQDDPGQAPQDTRPFPHERRMSPTTGEGLALIAFQIERLCADLQDIETEVKGLRALALQAISAAEANARAIAANNKELTDAREALGKHEKRAEAALKTYEDAGAVRRFVIWLLAGIVTLATVGGGVLQLLGWIKSP